MPVDPFDLQMRVTKQGDKTIWSFNLDGREVYELLCSHVAWRIMKQTGKTAAEVENTTIQIVHDAPNRKMKDLEEINCPFIKAVLTECKRLGMKTPHEERKENEE